MKNIIMVFVALAAVSAVSCGNTQKESQPKVIAHRGFWQADPAVPHNSIAALKNSIALGCFGTEFDIHVTTDGVPVVFHDNATKNKKVALQGVTYAELMEQDGILANGEAIPTLDQFLDVWAQSDKKVKLIFEIKNHGAPERDEMAAAKVHEVALAHGILPEQMEYIAFSKDVCKALSAMNTGVPVAYLNGDLTPAEAKEQLGCTGIDYHMKKFRENPDWIAQAHELGMVVNVWTVNSDEDLGYFIPSGVDYITTDRPDVLTDMLSAK